MNQCCSKCQKYRAHIPASPVQCAASLDQVPLDKTVIEETDCKATVCTNLMIHTCLRLRKHTEMGKGTNNRNIM